MSNGTVANLPQARVPIGSGVVTDAQGNKTPVDIIINEEWMRAFSQLLARTGGTTAPATVDELTQYVLSALLESSAPMQNAIQQLQDAVAQAQQSDGDQLRAQINRLEARINQFENVEQTTYDTSNFRNSIEEIRTATGV